MPRLGGFSTIQWLWHSLWLWHSHCHILIVFSAQAGMTPGKTATMSKEPCLSAWLALTDPTSQDSSCQCLISGTHFTAFATPVGQWIPATPVCTEAGERRYDRCVSCLWATQSTSLCRCFTHSLSPTTKSPRCLSPGPIYPHAQRLWDDGYRRQAPV